MFDETVRYATERHVRMYLLTAALYKALAAKIDPALIAHNPDNYIQVLGRYETVKERLLQHADNLEAMARQAREYVTEDGSVMHAPGGIIGGACVHGTHWIVPRK